MKTMFPALMLCFAFTAAPGTSAAGDPAFSAMSNASGMVADGTSMVVRGSLDLVAASGAIVVGSVESAGGVSMVVLNGASDAASATVRLSGEVVKGASLVVGTSVGLVAVTSGYLLVSAGKVLAFIPNEIGHTLLNHSRVGT